MITLAYTNIFTADIDRLANFYGELFGLDEIVESRSPLFRDSQPAVARSASARRVPMISWACRHRKDPAIAFFRHLMRRTPTPSRP
jgi:hypothetical protein